MLTWWLIIQRSGEEQVWAAGKPVVRYFPNSWPMNRFELEPLLRRRNVSEPDSRVPLKLKERHLREHENDS